MCVVQCRKNSIMVPGSGGASSVNSKLGGYPDGLILVVPYVRWQTRRETRRNVDIVCSMPRYIPVQ
jgi:hypothetical protein